MAATIETKETEEKGIVITFDNKTDYVVIKLKSDDKNYVEHKVFAEKLIKAKKAELVKDAKIKAGKPNTIVID